MDKKVLVYGFDKESDKYNLIKEEANKLNIDIIDISEDMLNQKVGYLMGIDGYSKNEDTCNDKKEIEFLLFSDFDRKDLTEFLLGLRNNGLQVPHKSVITETTKDWTLKYLLDHIEVEHRVMEKFALLGTYVKKARERLKEEKNAEIEAAINSAMELTKKTDITENDLDEKFKLFINSGMDVLK